MMMASISRRTGGTLAARRPETQTPEKAHGHEARLAQIELAGESDIQIQADRGHKITGGGYQKARKKTGQIAAHAHGFKHNISDDHHCI